MHTIYTATQQFIKHCRFEKNLSTKTIKSYSIDLKQFTKFLIDRNFSTEIAGISKVELKGYLEELSKLKPKSIKRKIATNKALFNFLEFEDIINSNPWRKLKIRIKTDKMLPGVMDIKEIGEIYKVVYKSKCLMQTNSYSYFEYLRNIVTVELLFTTGARVSEISELKKSNITIQGSVTIKGKGNKERIIQICNDETLKIIKEYNNLRQLRNEGPDGYFLINRLGGKLSDQSIRNLVKKLAKKAGIEKKITPHVFRHTFATLLLEKDVDIKYIQSLLGHSSIVTTQIYTHVNREKQRQILKTKHPRKDFSMAVPLAI